MESDSKQTKRFTQRSSRNLDNKNDCLTDAFITIYKNSVWCIQSVYELFFKSLWQVLLFTREEIYYNQNDNKTMSSIDIMSMNNSAGENYSKELPRQRRYRHRLQRSNSQDSRQKIPSKINLLSNKTRVTVRSISNQNLNHSTITEQKHSLNTLGTIDSHIIVAPVPAIHCQHMTLNNDVRTNHIESENTNLREQLADALCRRSYEPLTFMNRGMCCRCCRPCGFPNVPFHYLDHYRPPSILQPQKQQFKEEKELSRKSTQLSDASETQSNPYSVSPSAPSRPTESPEDEPSILNNETNEQNQSIFSFPEHDTPLSQESEVLIDDDDGGGDDDDDQLKLDAQILVDDLIQNAQEKYQRILRMSISQDSQNNSLNSSKETTKSKSISYKSNKQKLPDDNRLCQELCNKLNLSDPNQISEIVRILASNAPHILKEQPPNKNILNNNLNLNKDNENTLCSQLLLHPPFKPKRLVHLCPDGSIQVLSAIDENSNENQQQYRLNYSNSAMTAKHMTYTESINEIHFDPSMIDNNSILSLQQKTTLFEYNPSIGHPLTIEKEIQLNNEHLKIVSEDNDPIVKINLDLNDETIDVNSEDDENSLPEIFFKRIIAPESCTTPFTAMSNPSTMNKKDEELHVRQKSHHNRSRSYTNKKAINIER